MSGTRLESQSGVRRSLAQLFVRPSGPGHELVEEPLRLQVHEDKCFPPGEWLDVGGLRLRPSYQGSGLPDLLRVAEEAVALGAYEWSLPSSDTIVAAATTLLGFTAPTGDQKKDKAVVLTEKRRGKLVATLQAVSNAAIRCGLAHPTFDLGLSLRIPLRRPITVVADTSAVQQGGVDFVARFLYPLARVKIPAISQMEILNSADNYFKYRRSPPTNAGTKLDALSHHVKSQGGQRVLLRLELHSDTELQRPRLVDPLRGIMIPDNDAEDNNLGIQQVQRSFADRLVLETAVQLADHASRDREIVILTADQGQARMALSEGLGTIFIHVDQPSKLFEKTLAGTVFHPFTHNSGASLYSVPLPAVLWELASNFGAARLIAPATNDSVEVIAMHERLSWRPHHSHDDLLWVEESGPNFSPPAQPALLPASSATPTAAGGAPVAKLEPNKRVTPPTDGSGFGSRTARYEISLQRLVDLIAELVSARSTSTDKLLRSMSVSEKTFAKYRAFLLSGGLITSSSDGISATSALDELWKAVMSLQPELVEANLRRVPSVEDFLSKLPPPGDKQHGKRGSAGTAAFRTYCDIAEICGAGLSIGSEYAVATPSTPTVEEFAPMALAAYRACQKGDDLVPSGAWLEQLALREGLHPLRSRALLEQAHAAGLIRRYFEGSTPDTRHRGHEMCLLSLEGGEPRARRVNLYVGSFLLPGRSTVSLKLEGVAP